uniref:Polymerase nucleotidyl transferase domain-containing protein n=1 Tax=Candidatus Kentrum sp. FW TaxID=2126338 RepID=A0A450TWQ5_9GAMM|nr:MAG: hypothetical protein BECKFW1821C_GA0114237_10505 [Candidatus Kentron sp. FW]
MGCNSMASPTSTKHDIIRLLHANEAAIRAFGVRRIGLFGSYQRDEARADSDVDLLVEFQPGETTFDHFMGLSFFCEELFGRRVEIVTPNSLSPYLGPRILREVEYVVT